MCSSSCHQKQGNHGDSPHRRVDPYTMSCFQKHFLSPRNIWISLVFLIRWRQRWIGTQKGFPLGVSDVNCTSVCCATWTLSNYVSPNTHSLNNGHYTINSALQTHSNAHLHTNKWATAHLCCTRQCLSEHLEAHRGSCFKSFPERSCIITICLSFIWRFVCCCFESHSKILPRCYVLITIQISFKIN